MIMRLSVSDLLKRYANAHNAYLNAEMAERLADVKRRQEEARATMDAVVAELERRIVGESRA